MAGHSKWANIKRKKEVVDKKRGNQFAKLSKAITMTVIEGNGATNPDFNVKLRLAIEKAKEANMPKENIERAIQKGAGPNKDQLTQVLYEGFGQSGSAILVKVTTDNPNRTIAEVRTILEKNGGKLASPGAVNYLFQRLAVTEISKDEIEEEELFKLAEEIEAIDMVEEDSINRILFPYENLGKFKQRTADEVYIPYTYMEVKNEEERLALENLIERLEDHDDVDAIFYNVAL